MKTTIRDRALGARGLWAGTRVAIVRARRPAISFIPAAPQTAGTDASPLAVNCIVFSKDRAMQLDLCLRSIERFAPYSGPIVVVYRATTRAFSNGYRALATNGHVRLVEQSDNFRRDVMSAIDPAEHPCHKLWAQNGLSDEIISSRSKGLLKRLCIGVGSYN